jgi:4,5-dihydroxyphthalate decarboxylase
MSDQLQLRLACWDYDRTRPLIDGRVRPESIDLQISVMRPREAFTRMLEREEFDVAEVSLANYMQLKAKGDTRFVGIPVALSRMFRHSCIYVRSSAGIHKPEDLIGRRIGAAQLDSTGVVFIKGMLSHDYGVTPDRVQWVVGGLESPARTKEAPTGHGAVEVLGGNETLVGAFRAAKLDAIISNHIPSPFLVGDPQMLRLFTDFKTVEQEFFRRTKLFPIMHTIAIRADVHAADSTIAPRLYAAFCAARDRAIAELYDTDALRVAVPWLIDAIDESRRLLGRDYWSYGAEPNRKVWETLSAYLVEQHLAPRAVTLSELFVTE